MLHASGRGIKVARNHFGGPGKCTLAQYKECGQEEYIKHFGICLPVSKFSSFYILKLVNSGIFLILPYYQIRFVGKLVFFFSNVNSRCKRLWANSKSCILVLW